MSLNIPISHSSCLGGSVFVSLPSHDVGKQNYVANMLNCRNMEGLKKLVIFDLEKTFNSER